MRTLHTEITISAPISTIWKVLTDFSHFPQWNPFIKSMECSDFAVGKKLKATMCPPNSKPMVFSPKITQIKKNQIFAWKGKLLVAGLFDGEHIFELIQVSDHEVLFIHRENFSGILVPFLWKSLQTNVKDGFEQMNKALKERSEKMNELQLQALSELRLNK